MLQMLACNTLLKIAKTPLNYDALGRLTDGCRYDPLDRLIAYDKSCYTYDGFNRRISENGSHFVYDGNREIGKLNPEGEWEELRLLGECKGAESGGTIALLINKILYATLTDLRGSVGALFDMKGKLKQSYSYTAFGELKTTSSIANPWTFCSKRQDSVSGWIFFGRRHYAPKLKRFTTPDPLGYTSDLNLYLFVHNNPLTHSDLYGYRDEVCPPPRLGPLESRSLGDFASKLFRTAMKTVEWIGKNMIPLPGVRDVVEAVGRWGAGGKLFQLSEYMTTVGKIIHIPGKQLDNAKTIYENGIFTSEGDAVLTAKELSRRLGGIEIYLILNPSRGLVTDLLECALLKIGTVGGGGILFLGLVTQLLTENPNAQLNTLAHSQAGIHINNAAQRLSPEIRAQIRLFTFGSGAIVSKDRFGKVKNFVSTRDLIPMNDFFNYLSARITKAEHVTFLAPSTYNPFKEHSILGDTYLSQFEEISKLIMEPKK